MVAARVAARLEGPDRNVRLIRGGLGELRVTVDGRDVFKGNRLLYPRTRSVLEKVQPHLEK